MNKQILDIIKNCEKDLATITSTHELDQFKSSMLGKNSVFATKFNEMKDLVGEEKKQMGIILNKTKEKIQSLISTKKHQIDRQNIELRLQSDRIDITIPARRNSQGGIHPISRVYEEMKQIFGNFGFSIANGPNIENEWYNFTALNIPQHHPARRMHDTFYLNNDLLLRTHTSTVQIRAMSNSTPPFRFISFGRTYRSDMDATHTPMFHQIEGVLVDEKVTMSNLKYFLKQFVELFFERPIQIRMRPSYFPFTEPSAEIDILLDQNKNEPKNNINANWLEVLGCGMIHPSVLRNVNIDPEKYQGFAFGLGVERFAMLKYGIKDLRQMFEGDKRFLQHYNFSAFDIPTIMGGLTK